MRRTGAIAAVLMSALLVSGCVGNPVFYEAETAGPTSASSPKPTSTSPTPTPTPTFEPSNISPADVPPGFQNSDALRESYPGVISAFPLELPEGMEYPENLGGMLSPDELYEIGIAQGQVAMYARCVWLREYLESTYQDDNLAEQQRNLDRLTQWSETEYARDSFSDDPARTFRDRVNEARAGDPAGLREFPRGTC